MRASGSACVAPKEKLLRAVSDLSRRAKVHFLQRGKQTWYSLNLSYFCIEYNNEDFPPSIARQFFELVLNLSVSSARGHDVINTGGNLKRCSVCALGAQMRVNYAYEARRPEGLKNRA